MAVIMQQTLPPGVPIEMLDEVSDEMGIDDNPPDGVIVHTHFEQDGGVHVVDVWENADQYRTFVESRLMPAMVKVAAARGFELPPDGPEPTFADVHRLLRGRSS